MLGVIFTDEILWAHAGAATRSDGREMNYGTEAAAAAETEEVQE